VKTALWSWRVLETIVWVFSLNLTFVFAIYWPEAGKLREIDFLVKHFEK